MDAAQQAELNASRAAEEALERQRLADKQRVWDANWDTIRGGMRGIAGPTGKSSRLRPGDKLLIPER
jgi:hypothetical protein